MRLLFGKVPCERFDGIHFYSNLYSVILLQASDDSAQRCITEYQLLLLPCTGILDMRCFADIHLSSLFVHHYDFVWLHRIGAAVGKGSEHHLPLSSATSAVCSFFLLMTLNSVPNTFDFHSLHVDDERMSGVFGYLVVSLAFKFNLAIVLAEILWCILDAGEQLSATTLLSGRVMLTCSPSWVVISVSGIAAYCLFSLYIIPIITMQIGRAIAAAIWVHLRTLQGELPTGSYLFMNFGLDTCQIFVRIPLSGMMPCSHSSSMAAANSSSEQLLIVLSD